MTSPSTLTSLLSRFDRRNQSIVRYDVGRSSVTFGCPRGHNDRSCSMDGGENQYALELDVSVSSKDVGYDDAN